MRESRNLNGLKYAAKISPVQAHLRPSSGPESRPGSGGLEPAAATFPLLHGGAEKAVNVNYLNLISVPA